MRILLVEDEAPLRETLGARLKREGYAVDMACDGDEGFYMGREVPFDVAVIDLGLPKMSGMDLVRALRAEGKKFPILILTARTLWQDKVEGLKAGADDYLVKPFSPRELLARIKAVLRRFGSNRSDNPAGHARREGDLRTYRFSGWELSTGTRRLLSPSGQRVELTNGEYALLMTFLKAPRAVLSRDQLLEGSRLHDDIYDRSIDVQILRLRRKIEADPNEPRLIRTERGAGYFFDSDVGN